MDIDKVYPCGKLAPAFGNLSLQPGRLRAVELTFGITIETEVR